MLQELPVMTTPTLCANYVHADEQPNYLSTAVTWVKKANSVRRQRLALKRMNQDQLRDIGLSHEMAQREARRPFWDFP